MFSENGATKNVRAFIIRILLYLAGIIIMGFGIVLCVKCRWGVSPINSIPYVLSRILPLSLGTITILFYLINMAVQLILNPKTKGELVKILLQLPIAIILGLVIDMWNVVLPDAGAVGMQILCLAGSVFFTALGILFVVSMNLSPDPPTGTIQSITRVSGKKLGNIKITYDCSCVGISLLISFLGAHRLIGFGLATIVSAVCVGRILAFLESTVGKKLRRWFPEMHE